MRAPPWDSCRRRTRCARRPACRRGSGNGVVEPGEQCDDPANPCCIDCALAAPGWPCADDGEPCTADTCDAGGTCVHAVPPPGPTCLVASASRVTLRHGTAPAGDRLAWRWKGGAAASIGIFGSPTTTSDYLLCIRDGAGRTIASARVPAAGTCAGRPCWTARPGRVRYRDPELTPDGIDAVSLRGGVTPAIRAHGRGAGPGLAPLPPVPPVAVVLRNLETQVCFAASYAASSTSARVYRAAH